jgi:hypothetical protein
VMIATRAAARKGVEAAREPHEKMSTCKSKGSGWTSDQGGSGHARACVRPAT